MTSLKPFAAVLALLAALALVACGGDDSGDDGALSAEEYSEQVDAELAAFNEEFVALGQEAANPESREDYAASVSDAQDRVTEAVDTLEELEPPEEATEFHDSLVAALSDLDAAFTPVVEAAEGTSDQELLDAATELQQASTEFSEQAAELQAQADEAGLEIPNLTGTTGG
jgi:hypothetical protein